MRVMFSADITADRKNKSTHDELFVDKELSPEQEKALNESIKLKEIVDKEFEPAALINWIGIAAIVGAVFFGVCTLEAISETSFAQYMQELSWMLYTLIVCVIVSAAYILIYIAKVKRTSQDEKIQRDIENINNIQSECLKMLGVPEDASLMDALSCLYRIKNGEIHVKRQKDFVSFINLPVSAFKDNDAFCMAMLNVRWAIPLAEITGISKVSKSAILANWNKETKPNKGEYKKYRMGMNRNGNIGVKNYYAMHINHGGEEYVMYIPPYELPLVEELTGMKAEM